MFCNGSSPSSPCCEVTELSCPSLPRSSTHTQAHKHTSPVPYHAAVTCQALSTVKNRKREKHQAVLLSEAKSSWSWLAGHADAEPWLEEGVRRVCAPLACPPADRRSNCEMSTHAIHADTMSRTHSAIVTATISPLLHPSPFCPIR